jgi:hypothetical protein
MSGSGEYYLRGLAAHMWRDLLRHARSHSRSAGSVEPLAAPNVGAGGCRVTPRRHTVRQRRAVSRPGRGGEKQQTRRAMLNLFEQFDDLKGTTQQLLPEDPHTAERSQAPYTMSRARIALFAGPRTGAVVPGPGSQGAPAQP